MPDAVIVGSGPNGLAAAVTLARAGLAVELFEGATHLGGGTHTVHDGLADARFDWGSAVHPLALASPFFREFGLAQKVAFEVPELSYAHPLDGGRAALAWSDLERTAEGLGRDGRTWRRLLQPLIERVDSLVDLVMAPVASSLPLPAHPAVAVHFALSTLSQGLCHWPNSLRDAPGQALFSGVAAHASGQVPSVATAASGLVLATLAHAGGWPIPVAGSGNITAALAADFRAHGGVVHTDHPITRLEQLPRAKAVFFDTSAAGLLGIAGEHLDLRYHRALARMRHGSAAAKVDFVLSDLPPWSAPEVEGAGTLHLGGTRDEIAAAERQVSRGEHPDSPYVIASSPSRFDPSRVGGGRHVMWAYTHVPKGSGRDMTEAITAQIERFAPGFRDTIVASRSTTAQQFAQANPNFVGGDIATGAVSLRQLIARPVFSRTPWRAGPGFYLCSAAAAPGPGVHGMGGYQAAKLALREHFNLPVPPLSD